MAKRKASSVNTAIDPTYLAPVKVKAPCKRTQAARSYVSRPLSTVYNQAVITEHSDAIRSAPFLASLGLPPAEQPASPVGFRVLCVMPELETPRKVYEHFDDLVGDLASQIQDARDESDPARAGELTERLRETTKRRDITADFNLQLRMMKLAETPGFIVDIVDAHQCAVLDVYEMAHSTHFVDPSTYDVVFIDADDRFAMALANCGAKRVVLVGDTKNQPRAVAPTLTSLYGVISEEITIRNRQIGFDFAAPPLAVPTLDNHDAAIDAEIVRLTSPTR